MLMSTVSLKLQLPACVTIHNQCMNTELASPVYFGNDAICPKLFDQQINIRTKMNVSFTIDAVQDDFEGALLFKLQRHSDSQHNTDTLTTEINEATCIHMLVAWKVENSKPFVHVILIEHAKEFTWDEDKLRKLYSKNHDRLKKYDGAISDTWFIDDNMVLRTSFKVRGLKGNFELRMSISEEGGDDYAIRPLCIDLTR
jgi:hypothetical protein